MPLIVVSGFPCSGKTHRSTQLHNFFLSKIAEVPPNGPKDPRLASLTVHHVNAESLGLSRAVFASAREEKDARAAEMSAVKRLLTRDSIVILDSLNYIKGFRYQLHCEAKAVSTPSCVVHVGTPAERCRALNEERLRGCPETAYRAEEFENLVFRFEEPNGMNRWDAPLFTVLWDDATPPLQDIWEALVGASGAKKAVKPNAATVLKPAVEGDYLYELDRLTSDVVGAVVVWQRDNADGGDGEVRIEGVEKRLQIATTRVVTLPHLQRVRRQFIALNRRHMLEKGRIKTSFVEYLNDALSD